MTTDNNKRRTAGIARDSYRQLAIAIEKTATIYANGFFAR